MILRIFLLPVILFTAIPSLRAAGISDLTNGVYLVISGWPTNDPVRYDTSLVFMPFCNTGKVNLTYQLDPAYSVKIEMLNSNGVEVPKTKIGKRFGSKFAQPENCNQGRPYNFTAGGPYSSNMGMGGARPFSNYPSFEAWLRPEDLFKIEKPGLYSMQIQMQMFYRNPSSTNAWQQDRFEFSPITVSVIKPAD